MANLTGAKWNRGGAYRRNRLSLDFSAFQMYAEEIERLGGDVKNIVDKALTQAAETVAADTLEAVGDRYLPHKGKYSTGETKESVIRENEVRVEWSGNIGEVGLGFDKNKRGAGGFLITGTPRMQPDYKLEQIFVRKTYGANLRGEIAELLMDAIHDLR